MRKKMGTLKYKPTSSYLRFFLFLLFLVKKKKGKP